MAGRRTARHTTETGVTTPLELARETDPVTSHEAAAEVVASGRQRTHAAVVLELVRAHPGQTAGKYGELSTYGHHEAQRRLSDLKREGQVVQGKRADWNGHSQVTWWPPDQQIQLL